MGIGGGEKKLLPRYTIHFLSKPADGIHLPFILLQVEYERAPSSKYTNAWYAVEALILALFGEINRGIEWWNSQPGSYRHFKCLDFYRGPILVDIRIYYASTEALGFPSVGL